MSTVTTWEGLQDLARERLDEDGRESWVTNDGLADDEDEINELLSTGSITVEIGGRNFVVSLQVEEVA